MNPLSSNDIDPHALAFYRFQCTAADVLDRLRCFKYFEHQPEAALETACTLAYGWGAEKLFRRDYDGLPNEQDDELLADALSHVFTDGELNVETTGRQRRISGRNDFEPALDYIDPDKGYVKGNVIVVSKRAVRLRNLATKEELAFICDYYRDLLAAA